MVVNDGEDESGGNRIFTQQEQDGIIAGCIVGGLFLLICGVLCYVCCMRCRKNRRKAAEDKLSAGTGGHHNHQEDLQLPSLQVDNHHHDAEDDVDGAGGMNVNVPVPRKRRLSGYQNKKKSDLQPIRHKMPYDTLERAVKSQSIDEKRLKLEDVLGRGSFALVYNGRLYDKNPKDVSAKYQHVNVKTVHGPDCTPTILNQFVEEGMMLRSFKHPNILSLLGLVIRDDQPFVVLPLMVNGDLRNYLGSLKKHFTVRMLMQMGLHVAEGLKYLGEQGFVHQDIAARNCLVDGEGCVCIADYALSQNMFEDDYFVVENLSDKPLPIGWMAVETLTQLTYSLQTDLWSFGVLLWELLTRGQAPYSNMDAATMIAFVRTGQRLERPTVTPDKLYELMLNCWKEDPLSRPTISVICDTLAGILHGPARAEKSDYKRVIHDSRLAN